MSRLLAFDPGVQHVGWAHFDECNRLIGCGLLAKRNDDDLFPHLSRFDYVGSDGYKNVRVVIECPQIYTQARWKGDPNDLIDLALVAGAIGWMCRSAQVEYVRPHKWKGNAPKEAVHAWAKKRLNAGELCVLSNLDCPSRLRHNVLDAVAIGLYALGRLRQ